MLLALLVSCASTLSDNDGDGWSVAAGDCNDDEASIHPLAEETCNQVDDDCDGTTDGRDVTDGGWIDADQDGFGGSVYGCGDAYGTNPDDCEDGAGDVFPGATELCNGRDDDCDGAVDEGVSVWGFVDADEDGFGGAAVRGCEGEPNFVTVEGDCDDGAPDVHPDATETCDDRDEDCDGAVDEGLTSSWWEDADGDGYGAGANIQSCVEPTGYADNDDDCFDGSVDVTTDGVYWIGEDTGVAELTGNFASASDPASFSPSEGGVLHICPGEWFGNVTIHGQTVDIIGHDGPDGTALSGSDQVRPLVVEEGARVTLAGLTLTDGFASHGGAILVDDSTLEASDFIVQHSHGTGGGGGIYAIGSGSTSQHHVALSDCTVRQNTSVQGGGLYYSLNGDNNDWAITDCTVQDNEATDVGAGLVLASNFVPDLQVSGTTFLENEGGAEGGGVFHAGAGRLEVTGSSFEANVAESGGGAYCAGDCTVSGSTFIGNQASYGGGLGVSVATLVLEDATAVQDNDVHVSGGGVHCSNGQLYLNDTTVSGNLAGWNGGGVFVSVGSTETVDLGSATFEDNRAKQNGGGLWFYGDGDTSCSGCSFYRNQASYLSGGGYGGAINWEGVGLYLANANLGTGADDNLPEDITSHQGSQRFNYSFGDNASVTCTNHVCSD